MNSLNKGAKSVKPSAIGTLTLSLPAIYLVAGYPIALLLLLLKMRLHRLRYASPKEVNLIWRVER